MPPLGLDIWILAGQSNMQGCGLLQGALEADERVWNFTSAGEWEIAREPLHRLWESYLPVHRNLYRSAMDEAAQLCSDDHYAQAEDTGRAVGAGLGLSFGRAMADATGRPVGLIPAAHGGVSLAQWDFRRRDEGGASLYGAMLLRVRDALKSGGRLRGLLWYQGESDANEQDAGTYFERFSQWIEAVRADLDFAGLPVICAQIGGFALQPSQVEPSWQPAAWQKVRQAQLEIPLHVPATSTTATIDLALGDIVHLDTVSLVRLGKRLARLALGGASPRVTAIQTVRDTSGASRACLVCKDVSGGWLPRQGISGFETRTATGKPHSHVVVINAEADPANPCNIYIHFNRALDDTVWLGYALGLNPYCNAVDEADMPLCAFEPIAIAAFS